MIATIRNDAAEKICAAYQQYLSKENTRQNFDDFHSEVIRQCERMVNAHPIDHTGWSNAFTKAVAYLKANPPSE